MATSHRYRAEINAVRQMPLAQASDSPAAIAILANQSISDALDYIADKCGRNNDPNWASCDEVRKNSSWRLMLLVQQSWRCEVIDDVIRLAGRKLVEEMKQAVDNNMLSFRGVVTDAAESFKATSRRRVKAALNDPGELSRFGCEEDEGMRNKKAARSLCRPRTLEHAAVVRENGRVVPYKWRRRSWLDDEEIAVKPWDD